METKTLHQIHSHEFAAQKACRVCGRAIVFYFDPDRRKWTALDVASAREISRATYELETHGKYCERVPAVCGVAAPEPRRARGVTAATEEIRELYSR